MSQIRLDLKYKPEEVIPYLADLFYNKKGFTFHKMYLVGSRGRTSFEDWDKLEGRDWDILILSDRYVERCTYEWCTKEGFHMEILCGDQKFVNNIRRNNYNGSGLGIEIFPNTPPELQKYL